MTRPLTLFLIFFLAGSTRLHSQKLLEFIGDRFFLGSLKHQVWRPHRSLTKLNPNDTISFFSRLDDKAATKAFNADFERKEEGDIRFTRFHKVKERFVYTDYKTKKGKSIPIEKKEWRTIGRWSYRKERLKLIFSSGTIVIEWLEFSRHDMRWAIREVIQK